MLGGGAAFVDQSAPTLLGCVFKGNRSLFDGGAVYVFLFEATTRPQTWFNGSHGARIPAPRDITLASCVFDSNYALGEAAYGGGLYVLGPVPVTVRNCTFGRNDATTGGGIGLYDGSITAENTIVADNTRGGAVGMTAGATATLQYCDLYGNTGGDWTGSIAGQNGINGNICQDPLFVAAGDYRLTASSPCVDAGDPAGAPDPDGSRADMGALFFDQSFGLAASVTSGTLTLTWASTPRAAAYWIYGAADQPFFVPGYFPGFAHRVAIVDAATLVWSTAEGVGDPSDNWCYLVVAVGQDGLPIVFSNRVGEYDAAWDIP